MEDESGKLIDGTARARQWRRSRSASARAEGPETRSAAPKSIAASLLVPAEMLGPAASPGSDAAHIATATDEVSAHINPFLMPEAFGAGDGRDTSRKSGRRGLERRRRLVPEATARRAARLTIPIAFAVAAIAATTIAIGGRGRVRISWRRARPVDRRLSDSELTREAQARTVGVKPIWRKHVDHQISGQRFSACGRPSIPDQ